MERLIECLPQKMFIEAYGVIPDKERRRPGEKLLSDGSDHLIMRRLLGIQQLRYGALDGRVTDRLRALDATMQDA